VKIDTQATAAFYWSRGVLDLTIGQMKTERSVPASSLTMLKPRLSEIGVLFIQIYLFYNFHLYLFRFFYVYR